MTRLFRNKKIIAAVSLVLALLLVWLLFFFKGRDELRFFERQNVNQYLSENPFEQDGGGNNVLMPVAVAAGIDGYDVSTFLGTRNQMDYLTGCIEVKVAVTQDNEPVLADSFAGIGEEPVSLGRVISQLGHDDDNCLVINLSEYSRLYAIHACLLNNEYLIKSVITGVHENAVEYVKQYFPKTRVLCDWGTDNKRSLEEIAAAGANGILVDAKTVNSKIISQAKALGLVVWVDCESDIYATVTALKFSADGVITSRPNLTLEIGRQWYPDVIDYCIKQGY